MTNETNAVRAGAVAGAVLDKDGVALIRKGTESDFIMRNGGQRLYPASVVAALEGEVAYYKENFLSCMATLNACHLPCTPIDIFNGDACEACITAQYSPTTQPPHQDRGEDAAFIKKWEWLILSRCRDEFAADLAALTEAKQQGPGEEGFVLMPSEATDAMLQAFKGVSLNYQDILYQDRLLGGNVPGITDRDQVVRAMETYNFAKRYRAMVAACALATAPQVEAKRQTGEGES
jgi:hypothetical protein